MGSNLCSNKNNIPCSGTGCCYWSCTADLSIMIIIPWKAGLVLLQQWKYTPVSEEGSHKAKHKSQIYLNAEGNWAAPKTLTLWELFKNTWKWCWFVFCVAEVPRKTVMGAEGHEERKSKDHREIKYNHGGLQIPFDSAVVMHHKMINSNSTCP